MATGSSKDVKLTLSIETLGQDDIKALQTSLQQLASSGSSAAPEFQRLADEIDRLGQQSSALESFKSLSDQIDVLAQREQTTIQRVTELKTALEGQSTSVTQAQQRQTEANAALLEGQQAYIASSTAVKALKAETDTATKQTSTYTSTLKELVVAQGASQAELVQLRADQKAATAEVSDAVSAQGKLETAYKNASKQADAASASLNKQLSALQESAQAVEDLGVSTADVATSEGNLLKAFNDVGAAAQRYRTELAEVAQADAELATQQRSMNALYAEARQELDSMALAQVDATRALQAYENAQTEALAEGARWQEEADNIVSAANATQALARQTAIAAAAAKELAAQDAFAKAASDSQKLVQAAEYVRFWEQALQEGGTEAQKTAAAAQAAAEKIENAFSTIGVRSVESLNAELVQVRTAMDTLQTQSEATGATLSGAFSAGQARIEQLELEIRTLNGTLTTGDRLAGLFKNSLGQIAAGNIIADAVGYLVNKVKELAVAFVETIAQTQQFQRAMNALYHDQALVASQFAFLKQTAIDAGVAVGGIQQSFVKFSASTKSANIPLAESNALFAALVKAGGTLGLSSEEVTGALEALSQMASKGTVAMEELRQQLGDRLPGALSLVAKGLGITDAQLIKLVESGNLAARDLFPALTQALQSMQGEVTGITPTFENLKNALTQTAQSAGDSGWANILSGALRVLAFVLGTVIVPLVTFSELILSTAKSIGILVGAVTTLSNPIKELGDTWSASGKKILAVEENFRAASGLADQNTKATIDNAKAQQASNTALTALSTTQVKSVAGTQALAVATTSLGNSNQSAASNIVQLNVKLNEQLAAQTKAAEASDKSAKATKTEGDNLVNLARLRGDARLELDASVLAAERYQAAEQKSATAHQAETDILNVQKAALLADATARGLTADQIKAQAQALDQKILKSQAETDQSKANAAAAALEITQRQVLRQSYDDISGSVTTYLNAIKAAEIQVDALTARQARGYDVADQLGAAMQRLAAAHALYNKALGDSEARILRVAALQQAQTNLQLAGLTVQEQALNQLAASARATGDYTTAIIYEVDAKRIQIQITQLQAQAKKLEAQAELDAIAAETKAAEATGTLTEAKKNELKIRTLNAQAKLLEAGASDAVIKALQAEIDAIYKQADALNTSNVSRQNSVGAINNQTQALTQQNAALQRNQELATLAANDPYGRSPDEIARLQQQGGPADNSYVFSIQDRLNKGTPFQADELQALTVAYQTAKNNALLGSGQDIGGRAEDMKWVNITRRAVEQAQAALDQQTAAAKKAAATNSTTSATTATPTTAATGNTTHVVTINLGGQSTNINTASAADADALAALLKSLENAASTASGSGG